MLTLNGIACPQLPEKTAKGIARGVLDVFLPAGYPHTVTPDYTPYQIYVSLSQMHGLSIAVSVILRP